MEHRHSNPGKKPKLTKATAMLITENTEWNALDIINFHIVYSEADIKGAKRSFKPSLAHQIFGQREKMCGYLYPKIHLYFLANSAKCFFKFTHKGRRNKNTDDVNVKIFENLISWLPVDYVTDEKKFIQIIREECHTKVFGKKLSECELYNCIEKCQSKFIFCECPRDEPGFIQFHARFQCFIVWYIDAASPLDLDDPNWMFVYVYEEMPIPKTKEVGYYPVGYSAIYKFFHYPDKIRARISQCFILPCCQRMGVGYNLLTTTYRCICNLPNVVDITVEDPCPAFQRLRDTLDVNLLRELNSYQYPALHLGFCKKMIEEANAKYKINKRQCRRVYHILRLGYAIHFDEDNINTSLYRDIESFLGVQQATDKPDGMQETKTPAIIAKYLDEIRPITNQIVGLLRSESQTQ